MPHTNGWNRNVERLLKNWSQQISINEDEYRKRGTYYRTWYYVFAAFDIITQTGALTTLINVIISINKEKVISDVNLGLLVFVAAMETLILVAQGLDKFFNFGAGSEKYYEAANAHNALSRLIDATLILPRHDRDVAREVLLSIRQQFNKIQNNSPNLPPNAMVHRLDMCIYDDPSRAKGPKSSGVTHVDNGQSTPIPTDSVAIAMPESSPDDPTQDSDEEHVSNAQQCKFNAQIQEQKSEAVRNDEKSRALRVLEYQWRRMQEDAEDTV